MLCGAVPVWFFAIVSLMKKSEALNILGLQEGASDDEIKKAHRKLVIENHPDKFGQDDRARAKAEEKTKLINEARDVLLSRKWDPEYATAGTPYGAPFSYQPYTRPTGGSASGGTGQNPFAGWPFDGVDFVWTTWDAQGNQHTYRSGDGQDPFSGNIPFSGETPFGGRGRENPFSTSNPFTGSIPFDFSAFGGTLSPEQMLTREKKSLRTDIELIIVKAIILALCCVFSLPAMGFYLYAIISIGQGVYKRLSILSIFLVMPLLLLAFVFMPVANSPVGLFTIALFAFALGFDINNLRKHYRVISTLKQKIGSQDIN